MVVKFVRHFEEACCSYSFILRSWYTFSDWFSWVCYEAICSDIFFFNCGHGICNICFVSKQSFYCISYSCLAPFCCLLLPCFLLDCLSFFLGWSFSSAVFLLALDVSIFVSLCVVALCCYMSLLCQRSGVGSLLSSFCL